MNESGIHHRTFGNQQPLSLEVSIDCLQQYRRQFVFLQKMTEIPYCGLSSGRVSVIPLNPAKRRILSISYKASSICRSGRLNPFCRQVDAEHTSQHHWLAAPPSFLGVMGFNVRQQNWPEHYSAHFA